jgi:hypothetical protein
MGSTLLFPNSCRQEVSFAEKPGVGKQVFQAGPSQVFLIDTKSPFPYTQSAGEREFRQRAKGGMESLPWGLNFPGP